MENVTQQFREKLCRPKFTLLQMERNPIGSILQQAMKYFKKMAARLLLILTKKSTECITLINKIQVSINATNDQVKAAPTVDPLPLAKKVWQDLWAVSGATPENCLYTFVEIFIFKYLSDLGVLRGMYSFYDLLGRYAFNNDNEVLEYYASVVRVKIKDLFPGNPKDKTTIINGTIFVSKDDKAVSGYAKGN